MTDQGIRFHDFANVFPLLDGPEFDAMADDIRAHGLREPVVLFEGAILDGRNRYRACVAAGVDARFETYDGDDPLAYVISLNLKRRHLDESQRAMVAARIATLPHGANQHRSGNFAAPPTQEQAASILNVGERSVRHAREVLDEGIPELAVEVERGEVSVSSASEVARLPKPEQREIVAKGEKEIISTANRLRAERKSARKDARRASVAEMASAAEPASERFTLVKEPCGQAYLLLDEGSVDWIITDPPYPREFLDVYEELGQVAAHVLKPGGSLICMIGQSYLPDIVSHISKHLKYHWTLAYLTPGGQATQLFPRKVNTFWKPVLWFINGEYDGEWIGDVSRSKPNDNDKRFHEWGQSESGMRDLMSRFVRPGQTVLDPFMGAGTTGVIALELGAKFIGFDPDENSYNEALVRLSDASLVA